MSKAEKAFGAASLGVVALVIAGVGGWIANIVKLVDMVDGEVTGMFIARCVGVVAGPLGAILGYC